MYIFPLVLCQFTNSKYMLSLIDINKKRMKRLYPLYLLCANTKGINFATEKIKIKAAIRAAGKKIV